MESLAQKERTVNWNQVVMKAMLPCKKVMMGEMEGMLREDWSLCMAQMETSLGPQRGKPGAEEDCGNPAEVSLAAVEREVPELEPLAVILAAGWEAGGLLV